MRLVEKFLIVEVDESNRFKIVGEARNLIVAKEKAEKIRGKKRKYIISVYSLERQEEVPI